MKTSSWVMGIVGLGIGFLLGWSVFGNVGTPKGPGVDETKGTEEENETQAEKSVDIEVMDKEREHVGESRDGVIIVSNQSAGDKVEITSLTLRNAGWVAVREDRGGEPGNVLGARWFHAGANGAAEVNLLRASVPGGRYYVEYRSDDGDRDFDYNKDVPLEDEDGKELRVSFEAHPLDVGF